MLKIILLSLSLAAAAFAESPQACLEKIKARLKLFEQAAQRFDIEPLTLAAVVYTERTKNYDWSDKALDVILAKSGYNSTIGFCQVKLKTAYWIERQQADSTSRFFPGKKCRGILGTSDSPRALIKILTVDSLNILYAAAYIKIIQNRWQAAGYSIHDRPDITGTLYSTGLFNRDGRERIPRKDPVANNFGQLVLKAIEILKNRIAELNASPLEVGVRR